jgi:Ser/Thr protein kinase RdoA (MazF antagonist)
MSDENKVNRDALAGVKKSKQLPPLSSIPFPVKLGIQHFKEVAGLKNDGEAVAVLVAALLGSRPAASDWNDDKEVAEGVGDGLARLASVQSAILQFEEEREEREFEARRAARKAKEEAEEREFEARKAARAAKQAEAEA